MDTESAGVANRKGRNMVKQMECVICGGLIDIHPLSGWAGGYNADPVREGRCCEYCDDNIVLPMRMRRAKIEYVKKYAKRKLEDGDKH